jgi:YD repeat-containing protein
MNSVRVGGVAFLAVCVGLAGSVRADETVSYSYDALGRVITVRSAGGPNDGKQHIYRYDAAGNRTQLVIGDVFAFSRTGNVANIVSGGAVIEVNVSGSGALSGTVTFAENGVFLGSTQIFGNRASIFLQGLSPGVHTITVSYSGDDINEPYSRTFTIRVQNLSWLPAVLDLILSN